jgi:RNA recognition motif-containing protein
MMMTDRLTRSSPLSPPPPPLTNTHTPQIEDIHLVRDKGSGKSKGFAFLKYEDQRSTVLAVDNFNGIKVSPSVCTFVLVVAELLKAWGMA